ncbi:hypothetical protein CC78DRAFT_566615 [Lojkania enalia]|uniref:Uncharacterized protein n=1 Tax=Lojkania enalia TaxID=147567 RepID=A0A9P4N5D0_9PLEO|nr:hypothetical protein CC78DRAFT_566615 [Didymosphaeria enalia]
MDCKKTLAILAMGLNAHAAALPQVKLPVAALPVAIRGALPLSMGTTTAVGSPAFTLSAGGGIVMNPSVTKSAVSSGLVPSLDGLPVSTPALPSLSLLDVGVPPLPAIPSLSGLSLPTTPDLSGPLPAELSGLPIDGLPNTPLPEDKEALIEEICSLGSVVLKALVGILSKGIRLLPGGLPAVPTIPDVPDLPVPLAVTPPALPVQKRQLPSGALPSLPSSLGGLTDSLGGTTSGLPAVGGLTGSLGGATGVLGEATSALKGLPAIGGHTSSLGGVPGGLPAVGGLTSSLDGATGSSSAASSSGSLGSVPVLGDALGEASVDTATGTLDFVPIVGPVVGGVLDGLLGGNSLPLAPLTGALEALSVVDPGKFGDFGDLTSVSDLQQSASTIPAGDLALIKALPVSPDLSSVLTLVKVISSLPGKVANLKASVSALALQNLGLPIPVPSLP